MKCRNCGNELEENMKFCNNCGTKVNLNNRYDYYNEIIDTDRVILENVDVNKLLSREENGETISLESIIGYKLKKCGHRANDAYYIICAFDEKYPKEFIKFNEIEKKYDKLYSELKNSTNKDEYESKRKTAEICRKIEIHNISLLMLRKIDENWNSLIKLADNLFKSGEISYREIENKKAEKTNKMLNIIIIVGILLIVVLFIMINQTSETNSGVKSIRSSIISSALLTLVLLAIAIGIYVIPTIVACKNKHPYKIAIILIDIFLGWSLIGWVGALVWACILPKEKQNVIVKEIKQTNKYDDIKKLQELKESGAITEEEFDFEKARILNR